VTLLTLGCHSLVLNSIFGGRKGYSNGILTSITYVPPSYGVSGGPGNEARRWDISLPSPGWMLIWESVSD